jgi:hypothetical protein
MERLIFHHSLEVGGGGRDNEVVKNLFDSMTFGSPSCDPLELTKHQM